MQLDMFGATDNSAIQEAAPPVMSNGSWRPPETLLFEAALKRGSLGDAVQILNRLQTKVVSRVLLASGFVIGSTDNRMKMIAGVQSDIVAAAREKMTGHELRIFKEKSALLIANDNRSAILDDKEDANHVGRTLQSGDLSASGGTENRGNGLDGGVGSESLDAGLAGAGESAAGGGDVSGVPGNASEPGEGYSGERGGYAASVEDGNPAGVRGERSAAGDVIDVLDDVVREDVSPIPATDYVLTDEDRIGLGGLAEKFQDNLRAIRIVKALEAERRDASPEERRSLVRYVGWGGLKGVFDPDNKQWGRQHVALKALLSDAEWAAASRSQLDAHYTPPVVAKAMYSAALRLGFKQGRMLEPSVGVGNFFGLMPEEMRQGSSLHGVELDILTSGIVSALYPSAKIAKATGFQSYQVPAGYFDMVVGNPPFGSQPVTDDVGSVYSGWSIHNYFFAKSIDMLRPGGIMPMVVSHSFLDKMDPHVRQWISRRAELVSGVRLPNTAFKENANTEVVTDILIFRRRDEMTLGRQELPDWLNTSEVMIENPKTGEVEGIMVNDYFINNPEKVLGVQSAASSQFRANEYTVEAAGNLEERLAEWVASLPEGIYVPMERTAVAMEMSAVVPDGVKEGSFYVQDGLVFQRLKDSLGEQRAAAWEAPNQKAYERMVGMIGIRDTLRNQMRLERSFDASVTLEIENGRIELNRVYNDFRKNYGFLNDPINRRLFLDDTESALIQALEFDYEKAITPAKAEEYGIQVRPARAIKADILNRRVLFPPIEVANVETAKDALLHSLNMTGRVDMGYMQRAYGKDESDIIAELDGLLFNDPVEGLVTADAYLSGDVKTKLATAVKSAQVDASFSRNVEALAAVIPKDKLPSEIFASIGGAWIPANIYSQFVKEISGKDVSYSYISATAHWLSNDRGGGDYAKNNNEYGTGKMGAAEILFHTMNSKGLEIKKRVEIDGHERYVTDEEATEAVRQQGDKVRAYWDSWLWSDGDRADLLTGLYNEKFNRIVERQFDGSHLSFPGMNPAITLLEHQKNGVWRGLQDRVILLDQVVGAGKTYEKAAMAMEMRRLGIAKKPMFAVPNHLTLQWRSEFYKLFPGANVLAATPEDFDKENRERLFSKIVTGNWDAVIVGHSSLKKLLVPVETEMAIIKEQFDDMADAIEDMKRERGDKNIIRDMEKIKQTLEAKIGKLKEKGGKKDGVVDFGDLGVDALFIDELHEFKNLFFTTQMNRVAGLGNPAGSGKAFDLFVKVRWLQDTFGEKAPFVTATGTPVSNSLSEMFTMQRYMQYNSLKRDGLHMFDAWAKQYGDVQTVYEVAPSGTGYRLSQRFAKFKNLGSLMGSYRSFADVITLDDLKAQEIAQGKTFPVPKIVGGKPLNVVAQRSELQKKFFGVPEIVRGEAGEILFEVDFGKPVAIEAAVDGKWTLKNNYGSKTFGSRDEAANALVVEATTPRMTIDPHSIVGQFDNLRELTRKTKGKINALSLTGLANKAGLDYRIIDAQAEDFVDSKINIAVRNMLVTYEKWNEDKGVQLAFCDLSVPLSAKAKMASHEKRVYVRDSKGAVTHKKGTLHVLKEYEGLPYYLVAEGKGKDRTFTMFDPVTGVVLKDGFDSKQDAHAFVVDFVTQDGGQERWLDMREHMQPIELAEIDDYKNHLSLDNDGDAADFEISAQDIEGATGVAGFSVYDDIKAKLVAAGVPEMEVQFIHDHDTPQAKDALFKRVNAGEVRFLLGSTPKMGAGTNVQRRLVALHHIDAPWRPSDLEQREGRIIRRGNELYERDPDGFEVEVNRYATAQTYDTRRWQLLEHKAAGVDQLRNYNGDNEIDDVASEASNSADMKAAASGNPLILKETQLATEVKKLISLERAHRDNEYVVRVRMHSNLNYAERFGPELISGLKTMMVQRDSAADLGIYGGRQLRKKEDVLWAMSKIATEMDAMGAKQTIVYRGCKFEYEKIFLRNIAMRMADGDKHHMEAISPSGCITRMENFVNGIEGRITALEKKIVESAQEASNMKALLGKPFERADDLAKAIAEHGKVQRALMKANSSAAVRPEEMAAFEAAVAGQKAKLVALGFGDAVRAIELGDDDKGVVVSSVPRSMASLVEERRQEIESGLGYEFKWRGDTITEGHHGGRPVLENLAIEVTGDLAALLEDFTDLKGIGEISGKEYASFNDLVLELVGDQYTKNMDAEYSERDGKYLDSVDVSAVEMANSVVEAYDYDKVMEEFQRQLNAPGYDLYQALYSSIEMGKRVEMGRVRNGDVVRETVEKENLAMNVNRRDPTQVSAFNPYADGDTVVIAGQDWQLRHDTPGWYLTTTGNWRGMHPTIRNVQAMTDLIGIIEKAAQEVKAEGGVPLASVSRGGTPLTESEERARSLSSLAGELARQLQVESVEVDFDPADARVAMRQWIEGKDFSEEEMREALIVEVGKRPDFRRKAGVLASLLKREVEDSLGGEMASPLVSKAELDVALEKARQTLRIYTKTGDLYALAGNPKASVRAHVMADLMGVDKVPQAKAGVNALRDEFYRRIGIKEDTGAGMEDAFVDWFTMGKSIVVEDVSAKNKVQMSSTIQASLSSEKVRPDSMYKVVPTSDKTDAILRGGNYVVIETRYSDPSFHRDVKGFELREQAVKYMQKVEQKAWDIFDAEVVQSGSAQHLPKVISAEQKIRAAFETIPHVSLKQAYPIIVEHNGVMREFLAFQKALATWNNKASIHLARIVSGKMFHTDEANGPLVKSYTLNGKNVLTEERARRATEEDMKQWTDAGFRNPMGELSVTPKIHEVDLSVKGGKNNADMGKYILVAADSIEKLRKVDVYRVLVESNRAELRLGIADYIKENRPDLIDEVNDVLEENKVESVEAVALSSVATVVAQIKTDNYFYYVNGDLGMKSNGSFTHEKRHWMPFSRLDASRFLDGDMKPYGATRVGIYVGTENGERLVKGGLAEGQEAADKSRAVIGGQEGVNGYYYKGGQFLPSTMAEPGKWKVGEKWIRSGNELIEPGVFAIQPTPFSRPLYSLIGIGTYARLDNEGKVYLYEGGEGQGTRFPDGEVVSANSMVRPSVNGVQGKDEISLQSLMDAYNQGMRWFDVEPDAITVTTEVLQQKDEGVVEAAGLESETGAEKFARRLAGIKEIGLRSFKINCSLITSGNDKGWYLARAAEGAHKGVIGVGRDHNDAKRELAKAIYEREELGVGLEAGSAPSGAGLLGGGGDEVSRALPALSVGVEEEEVEELASVDVDHIKTRMVEALPDEVPAGWVVMNAPRPLLGNETFSGDFVTGRFYAAIDPADLLADKFVEENRKLDARLLVVVSRDVQMEMALEGSSYRDRYMEMDADKRYERLSGLIEKFRDLPYGELKKVIADVVELKGVVKEGIYSGTVLDVKDGIVVQKVGREGEMVRHDLKRLGGEVKVGQVVDIRYRDGVGMVGKELGVGKGVGG